MYISGFIILFIIIGICVWYWKIYKASRKQSVLIFQYLTLILISCNNKEDFEKQLWRKWNYDFNNTTGDDFNSIWETLCEAARIIPVKERIKTEVLLSSQNVGLIADNIYNNPTLKRYINSIKANYPDKLTIEQLKIISKQDDTSES